jgi:chorismate mutase/prephenate dehydratase
MTTTTAAANRPGPDGIVDMHLKQIGEHRQRIDAIDREILDLLNQRAGHALAIARFKGAGNLPEFAPERESAILRALMEANRGPLPEAALKVIFTEVISACRALQRPLRVAFLGPEATFSHQAVLQHFGSSCDLAPQATIIDVFDEVERGHSQVGVVPVENSSEGGVSVTLDQLLGSDLKVCGEVYSKVSQTLMSASNDLESIQRVYSHPQALSQCRAWLRRNLPKAALMEMSSTAAAARRAADEPGSAAVAGELTATHYGLTVLAKDIQDNPYNTTRFFVLCREACPPTGFDKTSIIFVASHKPGSLYDALGHLSAQGLNLTRIESRPTKDRPWEYAFFVDFEGHQTDDTVAAALAELAPAVDSLKVLGSYPQGDSGQTG